MAKQSAKRAIAKRYDELDRQSVSRSLHLGRAWAYSCSPGKLTWPSLGLPTATYCTRANCRAEAN